MDRKGEVRDGTSNHAGARRARRNHGREQHASANDIDEEDIASVFFTSTPDLNAAFPAIGARRVGLGKVALLGMIEIDVPDAVKRCVRVLIHWNTTKSLDDLVHVYLRGAVVLRPDYVAKHAKAGVVVGDEG
ncbi:MAG: chorismate mutase [Anaerolineae bacterium]|nr:chorismate mutase [Anaerolineae bacterium]